MQVQGFIRCRLVHCPKPQLELSLTARARQTQGWKSKALRPAAGAKPPTCNTMIRDQKHISITPTTHRHHHSSNSTLTHHSSITSLQAHISIGLTDYGA